MAMITYYKIEIIFISCSSRENALNTLAHRVLLDRWYKVIYSTLFHDFHTRILPETTRIIRNVRSYLHRGYHVERQCRIDKFQLTFPYYSLSVVNFFFLSNGEQTEALLIIAIDYRSGHFCISNEIWKNVSYSQKLRFRVSINARHKLSVTSL